MENIKKVENLYDSIKKQCDDIGVPLQHVCVKAGVDRSIVERWKKGNPKTIDLVNNIADAIEHFKNNKHE